MAGAAVIPLWGWVAQSCHVEIGSGNGIEARVNKLMGLALDPPVYPANLEIWASIPPQESNPHCTHSYATTPVDED